MYICNLAAKTNGFLYLYPNYYGAFVLREKTTLKLTVVGAVSQEKLSKK